ncbi:MAG: pantetheine-phosphate adenylyltransferase [candidate division Zixibacteria bacterium]|nr:pantetheine-phosphate adenylyltransferase [candidate division Zixibacteria bacterium]
MSERKTKKGKTAVYPGTFDPITNGHISLVERACALFDNVIVAVVGNESKSPLFTQEERYHLVKTSLGNIKKVRVIKFHGLLANLVKDYKACAIIRGLRAISDFEYEFQMALMNRKLVRDVETVFLMPSLSWVYLSSTIVKDVAANKGDIKSLVPSPVAEALRIKFSGAKGKKR